MSNSHQLLSPYPGDQLEHSAKTTAPSPEPALQDALGRYEQFISKLERDIGELQRVVTQLTGCPPSDYQAAQEVISGGVVAHAHACAQRMHELHEVLQTEIFSLSRAVSSEPREGRERGGIS